MSSIKVWTLKKNYNPRIKIDLHFECATKLFFFGSIFKRRKKETDY